MKTKNMAFLALAILFAGANVASAQCVPTTWNLTAGQTIIVGTVSVTNDATNIYVTYTLTDPCATFGTLHMWVGKDLTLVPSNPQGTPVPGQFCSADGGACYDATGLTTYTFTIPFADISIPDVTKVCGTNLFVVTHAEVNRDTNCDGTVDATETAFGGPTPGPGPRWWFYGTYSICCNFGPPPVCWSKTAFAKGGWVFVTDRKSNPENLPSLNLIKNRWGWAINLTAPGTYTSDIWAGAGLNDTSKAIKVGTFTIVWDGTTAIATYTMASGYALQEVHLYAGDTPPTTTAPGQFGLLDSFDPARTEPYSFTVLLSDTDGDGVWIIGHAVVSNTDCTPVR